MYTHLKVWTTPEGLIWHSFYRPGTRDMTMGELKSYEVERIIERARKNGKVIEDERRPV